MLIFNIIACCAVGVMCAMWSSLSLVGSRKCRIATAQCFLLASSFRLKNKIFGTKDHFITKSENIALQLLNNKDARKRNYTEMYSLHNQARQNLYFYGLLFSKSSACWYTVPYGRNSSLCFSPRLA